MAKITKSYESDIDLTVFTVKGKVTFDDILDQTRSFFSGKPTKLVVWDFTLGTAVSISNQEIKEIAKQGALILARIERGKCAIVVPKDFEYGMFRVFQVLSEMEKFPFEVAIYRDINAAQKWLRHGQ